MSFAQLNDPTLCLFWRLMRNMFWGSLSISKSLKPFFPMAVNRFRTVLGVVLYRRALSHNPFCCASFTIWSLMLNVL